MSKYLYHFDKDKIVHVKIRVSLADKIKSLLLFSSISLIGGIIITLIFFRPLEKLELNALNEQQDSLIEEYSALKRKITLRQSKLAELQIKDDSLYRTILELEPLDPTIRKAGFGGHNPYIELKRYDNANLLIDALTSVDIIKSQLKVQENSYESLEKFAFEKNKRIDHTPGIQPISVADFYRISDYFGYRRDPFTHARKYHYGVDITGPRGCPVYSTANGKVVRAEYVSGYGKMVEVAHGFGFSTRYAHLDDILVKVGAEVKRGTHIGTLGNTGRSTGPHLHYEVRVNNKPVNPLEYYCNNISSDEYKRMINLLSKNE